MDPTLMAKRFDGLTDQQPMYPFAVHHLLCHQARLRPDAPALICKDGRLLDYQTLWAKTKHLATVLLDAGLGRGDRVAVWLPKDEAAVTGLFAACAAGGVMLPINPLLKSAQVAHILADSGARVLLTQASRLKLLHEHLADLPELRLVLLDGDSEAVAIPHGPEVLSLAQLLDETTMSTANARPVESDLAALLYTSGSTGKPKGVMLSHRNLLAGAASVAEYLELRANDRLLGVLPFSFDYGLSQLTCAFYVGSSVMPLDYLLPRDLHKAIISQQITVLAGVPSLWHQLASQAWLPELRSLRVLTNSGGRLPRPIIDRLRRALPDARLFLMYGLTEAFRSTYLPPEELDRRPDSIGKAIPNAEVMVLRADGTACAPHEPGELVHRGPTVAQGYWNDPELTAERFRPPPHAHSGMPHAERAVWSGDRVRMDEEGFLYFIGRHDDMIKTSGYRISPVEIEDVLYASGLVREAAAIGIDDEVLGQRIVAVIVPETPEPNIQGLIDHCRKNMPLYMVPHRIEVRAALPLTPNGKVDRRALRNELTAAPSSLLEPA